MAEQWIDEEVGLMAEQIIDERVGLVDGSMVGWMTREVAGWQA